MKKMNKIIALVLTFAMTMSFTFVLDTSVSNAEILPINVEYAIGGEGFDLNPETQTGGKTVSENTTACSQTYKYTSHVNCSLNFQPVIDSNNDKYKGVGSYQIEISEGGSGVFTGVSLEQAKITP